jgi:hypothetical protein
LQYQLAGIQHLELYGQGEEQVLSDLVTGLKKRGVLGGGDEVVATRSMSIKRHEKTKINCGFCAAIGESSQADRMGAGFVCPDITRTSTIQKTSSTHNGQYGSKTNFRSRAHSSENFHSRGIPHG